MELLQTIHCKIQILYDTLHVARIEIKEICVGYITKWEKTS